MTTIDRDLNRAARVCYALLYEEAHWLPSVKQSDREGLFGAVVLALEDFHNTVVALTARTGVLYDAWGDARTLWEGMIANGTPAQQYGLLDQEIRRIAAIAIEPELHTNGNGTEKAQTDYTVVPTMPQDVNDLLDMERKPVIWFAPSFLREGLGLLVGQPNVGKTPIAIQLMIALATGGKWLDTVKCRQSKVLYLGMEYSPQELIPMFDISRMGLSIPRDWLLVKTIEDDFPTNADAALAELEWYLRVMDVRVICIDVLTAFLPPEKFKQNVYRGDYSELKPYHRLALKYNATILGIWHGSKRESDPRIMYNGSTGMWAAAASRITMYQDQEQRVRIASFPRMGDRIDWALTQEKTNTGRRWVVSDAAPEPMMSPAETQVYRCLTAHADKSKPLSTTTIAELTGIQPSSVRTHVARMFSQNILQRVGNGYYIESVADVAPVAFVADVAPVALQTSEKVLQGFTASESNEKDLLQTLHATSVSSILECLPPSQRTSTGLMLVSDVERNIDLARSRCEEHGLDYETLRKMALEENRNDHKNGTKE